MAMELDNINGGIWDWGAGLRECRKQRMAKLLTKVAGTNVGTVSK